MLTQEEEKEITGEIGRYEQRKAACIEALRIVQRHRGWVSDEAIRDIGKYLGMSSDEVDGVATFYNLIFRRPVGRHVLFVCDSVSCWVMGCNRIKSHLTKRLGVKLGETTDDNLLTVLPIACLGACDQAPVILLDGETYESLDPDSLDQMLERLRGVDPQMRSV